MATVYAKNPAELVIQNPHKKPNNMARKRKKNGRYAKKRSNPGGDFVDTGKNLFMQYGLAALASTGVIKLFQIGLKNTGLSKNMKEMVLVAGPAAAGIVTSMTTSRNNAIAQGVAGGMVLASVHRVSDKFIGDVDDELDDSPLDHQDLIVKADGIVYDQSGNPIAKIDLPDGADGGPISSKALTSGFDTISSPGNSLGDFEGYGGFESGEVWQP